MPSSVFCALAWADKKFACLSHACCTSHFSEQIFPELSAIFVVVTSSWSRTYIIFCARIMAAYAIWIWSHRTSSGSSGISWMMDNVSSGRCLEKNPNFSACLFPGGPVAFLLPGCPPRFLFPDTTEGAPSALEGAPCFFFNLDQPYRLIQLFIVFKLVSYFSDSFFGGTPDR